MAQESRLKTKHRGLLIESRFPYWECLGLLVASSNNKKKIAHTFRIILITFDNITLFNNFILNVYFDKFTNELYFFLYLYHSFKQNFMLLKNQ